MSPPFHDNKLESIGTQLELGLKVEEIAVNEKCSINTIYRFNGGFALLNRQQTSFLI